MARNFRYRKFQKFNKKNAHTIDYKNLELLRTYVMESGRIVPSRVTGVAQRYQRQIAKQVRYARFLALLPYCDQH